jgi:hypothetical protein
MAVGAPIVNVAHSPTWLVEANWLGEKLDGATFETKLQLVHAHQSTPYHRDNGGADTWMKLLAGKVVVACWSQADGIAYGLESEEMDEAVLNWHRFRRMPSARLFVLTKGDVLVMPAGAHPPRSPRPRARSHTQLPPRPHAPRVAAERCTHLLQTHTRRPLAQAPIITSIRPSVRSSWRATFSTARAGSAATPCVRATRPRAWARVPATSCSVWRRSAHAARSATPCVAPAARADTRSRNCGTIEGLPI